MNGTLLLAPLFTVFIAAKDCPVTISFNSGSLPLAYRGKVTPTEGRTTQKGECIVFRCTLLWRW